jgi:hypothetical protein
MPQYGTDQQIIWHLMLHYVVDVIVSNHVVFTPSVLDVELAASSIRV